MAVTLKEMIGSARAAVEAVPPAEAGGCGTIMCSAAAGYDGPTGVGTPTGLDGF